jgi:hypothetical protein
MFLRQADFKNGPTRQGTFGQAAAEASIFSAKRWCNGIRVLRGFFTGMALGGFLFAYNGEPVQIASNDATPQILLPNGAPPTTQR